MQVSLTSAPLIRAPTVPPAPILAALMQASSEQVPAHVQVPLEQVPLVNAPLTKVLSIPATSIPAPSVLIKDVSKVVIPEKFVSPNKIVIHKNLILTHLPNKVLHHDMPELSTNCFATYHPDYKKIPRMTECVYNPLLFQLPPNYHPYQMTGLTALSNLVLTTRIIRKSGRSQSLHTTSLLSNHLPSRSCYQVPYFIALTKLLIIIHIIKKNRG